MDTLKRKNTSLSKLIETYLGFLVEPSEENEVTPLVKSLSGIVTLRKDFDYKKSYKNHVLKSIPNSMAKIFVDTDVCIDLLSGRKSFNSVAEKLFSLADTGKIKICVSSFSFVNIDYVSRSQY
ncbi:MAG TPA: DUF6364 family protein [Bacteroidia bacterium]|nr:DUF6364 family protein [Bacteroidia bacterium]